MDGEKPPDIGPPGLRDLARLAVILNIEAVMVFVLELLYDIHQVDVGLLDVEIKWVDLLKGVNGLQV